MNLKETVFPLLSILEMFTVDSFIIFMIVNQRSCNYEKRKFDMI